LIPEFNIDIVMNEKISLISLFEIAKIHTKLKDFYQAEHCLSTRALYLGLEIKKEEAG
jgi:hypothetical protein